MKADNEVNVAEILKEYATPGQQLYTEHGAVTYKSYDEERQRIVVTEVYMGYDWDYDNFGHATTWNGGVDNIVSLFPSRTMRNWELFALKPGDVLCGERGEGIGIMAVFGGWTDDTYTRFKSPCFLYNDCTFGEGDTFTLADFDKVADCVRKRFYETLAAHYHERFDPVTGTLKTGTNRHLDRLWHDASEEPNRAGAQILLEQDFYGKRQYQVYIFNGSSFFRDVVDGCHIVRWLYIDDLQEGGNQ